ncbi:phosphatidate cytidylyltransferase [Actinomadura soli]|uniref:Phosphatidate cytidylyltransferase n=1 Tax=Actinomadura soli TaxID=2508997 RepID=A0A5C4J721_9ACTN|nr:phosphatidate cytidylyltransferase [Actinomadura soli]
MSGPTPDASIEGTPPSGATPGSGARAHAPPSDSTSTNASSGGVPSGATAFGGAFSRTDGNSASGPSAEGSSADGASANGASGAAEGKRQTRTGRNLPLAIGVGLALGSLVLLSLYTVKEIFLAVMIVFLFIGMRELTESFKSRDINVPFIPVATGMVGTPVVAYVWGPTATVAAVSLTMLALLTTRMTEGADGYVRDVSTGALVTGYLVLVGGIVALLMRPDDGDHRIVIFIATTVASDTGGFFAGSFLGKHKLAPTISPKKTWEGVTGSALMCMLVGGWLVWWLLDGGRIWQGVLVGLAVVVTATAGDLVESMMKRDLGIKDLGTILPGHGGVMDRLDSLVVTAPVVWLLLELFVPS